MQLMHFVRSKPQAGSRCNGCGYCCAVQPCELAQQFLGAAAHGACPALESAGGLSECGLVNRPFFYLSAAVGMDDGGAQPLQSARERELASEIADSLGVGLGCDSIDDAHSNAWPWPVQSTPIPRQEPQ